MSEKEYQHMSASEKEKEDWMNAKWRPMMGWMYMLVCTCDFVLFPVLWSLYHAILHTGQFAQWQPITLQGAGLFHMAMGAIIGVAAFGRTQEKLAGANNGGINGSGGFGGSPSGGFGGFGSPTPTQTTVTQTFGTPTPAASSFGGAPNKPAFGGGFGAKSSVGTSSCGRAMPAPQEDEPL